MATDSLAQALRLRRMFNVLHWDSVVKVDFIVRKNASEAYGAGAGERPLHSQQHTVQT